MLHRALPDPTLLVTRDDQIDLRRACVWSDTRALTELHAAWQARGAVDALRPAADLYRGPFLDGFSLPDSPEFDVWARVERERWQQLALQALAALVEVLALNGDHAGAIGYAQRFLASDELAEDMQRPPWSTCAPRWLWPSRSTRAPSKPGCTPAWPRRSGWPVIWTAQQCTRGEQWNSQAPPVKPIFRDW